MTYVFVGSVDNYLPPLLLREGLGDTPGQLWMTELDRRFYQVMVTQQETMPQEAVPQEEFDKLSWVPRYGRDHSACYQP